MSSPRDVLRESIERELLHLHCEEHAGWENYRSLDKFKKETLSFSLGELPQTRVFWTPIDDSMSTKYTTNLQKSRGFLPTSLIKCDDTWEEMMNLSKIDHTRIDELEDVLDVFTGVKGNADMVQLDWKPKRYCDIGFKHPKLLHYYGKKYDIPTLGIDNNSLSVDLARYNGYNSHVVDLANYSEYGLKDVNLITIHHVLEHISHPLQVIKNLYKETNTHTIIQAEIPIEYDSPNLAVGHMFGFYPGDLLSFFQSCGFRGLSTSTLNISNAYVTERVTVVRS